jgi:hypothetical protein
MSRGLGHKVEIEIIKNLGGDNKKMKRTIGLISVVAIAMALMIAFSGVASASWLTGYTPEKQTVNRLIGYDRTERGDQGFDLWKSSSTSKFGSFEKMDAYSELLATDLQDEWSTATGRISAGMSVYVAGDPFSYEERTTASGSFQFHKEMSYTSGITTP